MVPFIFLISIIYVVVVLGYLYHEFEKHALTPRKRIKLRLILFQLFLSIVFSGTLFFTYVFMTAWLQMDVFDAYQPLYIPGIIVTAASTLVLMKVFWEHKLFKTFFFGLFGIMFIYVSYVWIALIIQVSTHGYPQ